MTIPAWQYVASMGAYILLLYLMVEFMRKNMRAANIFFILALFTIPLWAANLDGWFRWVKTISVLIPTVFVGLVRLAQYEDRDGWWKALKGNWVHWIFYGVLFLNIAEASVKDLTLGNYFNSISGFILCATIPLPGKYWRISDKKPGDLVADIPAMWCFLYTTWNAAFVYAENPAFVASSICILVAAELYPLVRRRPDLYIMARVYTLAFHLLIRATYDIFTPVMDSTSWGNEKAVYIWGLINIVMHVPFAIWWFTKLYKERQKTQMTLADATA